jgi:hypothetical protein
VPGGVLFDSFADEKSAPRQTDTNGERAGDVKNTVCARFIFSSFDFHPWFLVVYCNAKAVDVRGFYTYITSALNSYSDTAAISTLTRLQLHICEVAAHFSKCSGF